MWIESYHCHVMSSMEPYDVNLLVWNNAKVDNFLQYSIQKFKKTGITKLWSFENPNMFQLPYGNHLWFEEVAYINKWTLLDSLWCLRRLSQVCGSI